LILDDLVRNIKVSSIKMMRQRNRNLTKFEWQDSYGIFTVSKSLTNAVSDYISAQKSHHQNMPFENELLTLLTLHEIDYDEKYVFG
jgi:putative transposase